jgi:hypothetical protein
MDLIGSDEAKHQARNRVLGLADADLAGPEKPHRHLIMPWRRKDTCEYDSTKYLYFIR